MTGTGTQNDPFIVDNWPDFVTAIGTTGAYVEFPEGGGNIDMNNYAPLGIPTIEIRCTSIKGNNWTISNLYCAGHSAFYNLSSVTISDLQFLDFYFTDQGPSRRYFFDSDDNRRAYYFDKCTFSGIAIGESPYSSDTWNSIFRQAYVWLICQLRCCSMNIQINGQMRLIYNTLDYGANYVEFCNIKLSGTSKKISDKVDYLNCYITGALSDTAFNAEYGSANYNVVNVDFSGASTFECTGRSGAINLINTDLLPAGATIGAGFIGVTTEQLRDAAYLSSLGFPIGVD